jgi:hypothetical protein
LSELTTAATDGGTYVITASFTDEAGDAVTPNTLTWSLYDRRGAVINSRLDETLVAAASVTIVLSGDDLLHSDGAERYLIIEGDYDSSNGSGLPLRVEAHFFVQDLRD